MSFQSIAALYMYVHVKDKYLHSYMHLCLFANSTSHVHTSYTNHQMYQLPHDQMAQMKNNMQCSSISHIEVSKYLAVVCGPSGSVVERGIHAFHDLHP